MDQPLEIAFRNMDSSEALEARVRERSDKMHRYFKHITSAHVAIELEHKTQGGAKNYRVRIEARVPGKELVVSQDPGQRNHFDPYQAVNDAFDAMDRQLEQFSQTVRGDVKSHEGPPAGRVRQLFSEYGFIATTDGRDIWFHRNAVDGDGFDKLEEGQPVELTISNEGNDGMGPQASSVRPVSAMKLEGEAWTNT